MIEVLAVGVATTVQDQGRRGLAHLGVGRSGAADTAAHDLANRLVGNDPPAATLESCGGLRLRTLRPVVVAVAGAVAAWSVDDGPPLGNGLAQAIPAGATLSCAAVTAGLRLYVAVRGGIDVPPVLGSRSRDTLGALGPTVADGDVLAVGPDPGSEVPVELVPPASWPAEIEVQPGPRLDWFADAAWHVLTSSTYRVTDAVSRVGARLAGPVLERACHDELPSEGLIVGAVQVPPDGQPIVVLADHPVTGGYPVIAVVVDEHLGRVAQARPGTALRVRAARR